MEQIKINCINLGRTITADGGTSLGRIASGLDLGFTPVCARVNNKTEGLHFCLYQPKTVEFLGAESPAGTRAYVRSVCMMLYRALSLLEPDVRLYIQHSISRGYYCTLNMPDGGYLTPDTGLLQRVKKEMQRLVEACLPFVHHEDRTERVIELFESQGRHDTASMLATLHTLYTGYYSLDGVLDIYDGALVPDTGVLTEFDLRPYHKGFLLVTGNAASLPTEPQEKMYRAFTDYVEFNTILGVRNAGEMNHIVQHNHVADLINVAEALHGKYLARIADDITERYRQGGARIVLIAGPSSSGKTTTTKRLAIQLMTNLLKPQMISLDNYFVNRELTPRDADGDYDYESLHALDLAQFNSDLSRILAGEEVAMPTYNFELGRREYRGNTLRLRPGDILLIEGIHGLNPDLTAQIPEEMKFRVYVSALTTLTIDSHNWVPTTDNRLLRRIIRDYKYRGISASESIRRWPSVRRGEERWIFPYQENADAMFNSSLLFELGVMRKYAEHVLLDVKNDQEEYSEAYRLRRFLEYFDRIPDEFVPPTSLLREFLGGSSFHY